MKVIAIANQKGGAGKTSTASALWYWLNHNGHDALAIDLDAQCNLSSAAAAKTNGGTALGILTQELAAPDVIQHTEQGDIIAASAKLSAADTMLADETGKEFRIKEALEPLADAYDFAIIDTPPHIGVLTKNALTAADYVVIPSQGDAFSLSEGRRNPADKIQPTDDHLAGHPRQHRRDGAAHGREALRDDHPRSDRR